MSRLINRDIDPFFEQAEKNSGAQWADNLIENLPINEKSYKAEEISTKTSLPTTQAKIKTFICYLETCRKEFSQHHSLQKHERIHKGEKPYVCKDCGHAFTQRSNLKRHERLHTGEKPYVCPHCPKKFSNNSNLKQHVQIHEDNKSRSKFFCYICSRFYYYQSSLKKHMKEHENKPVVEGFESPSTAQSELDCKLESDCFSEGELRKKIKTENDVSQKSENEHEPCLSGQAQISDLPLKYQEILLNKGTIKQLQHIAIKSAMLGTNAEDSFAKIFVNFEAYFENGERSQASNGSEVSFSEESSVKESYNNRNEDQANEYQADFGSWYAISSKKYSFEDMFMKDELEGSFLKDDGEDSYFGNKAKKSESIKIKNYFDEIHHASPFCKVEETL